MPQIGWFEILVIVAISIVVIGPKDFPIMLKKMGSWIGSVKKYFRDLQNEVEMYDDEEEKIKDNKENKTREFKDEK